MLPEEVERGLACGCICASCGHRLEAHQGDIKAPYFAHDDGAECAAAYQTALHILAKEVLQEEKKLLLPSLRVYPSEDLGSPVLRKKVSQEVVKKGITVEAREVDLERKIGGLIPDVIFRVGAKALLVEIWVTHRVDEDKKRKIESLDLPTIEFDFSKMDRVVTKKDLRAVLVLGRSLPGFGGGRWIFHPKRKQVQAEVDRDYNAKKPALEAELSQWQERKRHQAIREWGKRQQEQNRKEQEERAIRMLGYGRKAEERRAAIAKAAEEKRKKESLF